MALELTLPFDSKTISIEEYSDIIQQNKYDLSNHEDIIESAKYFNQLNNNKKFVLDHLCYELKDLNSFQRNNFYGPQVFIIHKAEKYFIRAVIWNPLSQAEKLIDNFKYDICHDHNFDFLTAGYLGPGYKTMAYTYEYEKALGCLEEKVDMIQEGMSVLSEGTIMFYRSKRDIHIQLPPESLSVSINLIIKNKVVNVPQFQFDEQGKRIARYIHSSNSEFIIRLAGVCGDKNNIEPLFSILRRNENSHLKAFAAYSIIQIAPELIVEVEDYIHNINDELLTNIYFREVNKYGSTYDLT